MTTLKIHQNAIDQLDGEICRLNKLAVAAGMMYNIGLSDELFEMAENLAKARQSLQNAFDTMLNKAFNDASATSGMIMAAAIAGVQLGKRG